MKNEAVYDRVFRIVLGLALLSLLYLLHVHGLKYWSGWIGVLGLYPLVTGLTGHCPIYKWRGGGTRATSATKPPDSPAAA